MQSYRMKGGCHCGNITAELWLSREPGSYTPRACDCDFCRKHGASYVSDPAGSLRIHVEDERFLWKYRQGSRLAECLLCMNCGVLIGAAYEADGSLWATINSRILEDDARFGETNSASPRTLSASEKVERWKGIWFSDVAIVGGGGV